MNFAEQPTNTAARGSNGAERSRWRDEGVDPGLVADPFDVAQAAEQERERTADTETAVEAHTHERRVESDHRPLGALVAEKVMAAGQFTYHPALAGVQLSFERR